MASHREANVLLMASHREANVLLMASHREANVLLMASHREANVLLMASHREANVLLMASHREANVLLMASHREAMEENLTWISTIKDALEINGMHCLCFNNYENHLLFIHQKIFQTLSDEFHQGMKVNQELKLFLKTK